MRGRMKNVHDFEISGKRVFVRSALNVPLDERGFIEDDFRLKKSVPTIRYVTEQGAKCIVIGHLGRPQESQEPGAKSKKLSLRLVAKRLEDLLQKKVKFGEDCVGDNAEKQIAAMNVGEVLVLENLRFYEGEEQNDAVFARDLAKLADVYVNDAFDVAHRAHASIVGLPQYLPSAAGLLLEKEVSILGELRENPARPMIVIVGGAKVETKASFINSISEKANAVLVGNLIAREISQKGVVLKNAEKVIAPLDGIPYGARELDIGPKTIALFQQKVAEAATVFWAGPLGKIEESDYQNGTLAVADTILQSGAFSVIGGGDLGAFLGKQGLRDKFGHVSTGGSAMLAFLAGEKLPGLEVLHYGAD